MTIKSEWDADGFEEYMKAQGSPGKYRAARSLTDPCYPYARSMGAAVMSSEMETRERALTLACQSADRDDDSQLTVNRAAAYFAFLWGGETPQAATGGKDPREVSGGSGRAIIDKPRKMAVFVVDADGKQIDCYLKDYVERPDIRY